MCKSRFTNKAFLTQSLAVQTPKRKSIPNVPQSLPESLGGKNLEGCNVDIRKHNTKTTEYYVKKRSATLTGTSNLSITTLPISTGFEMSACRWEGNVPKCLEGFNWLDQPLFLSLFSWYQEIRFSHVCEKFSPVIETSLYLRRGYSL